MDEQRTISQQIEDIKTEMCDHYCHYPYIWDEDDGELADSEICANCPLGRLRGGQMRKLNEVERNQIEYLRQYKVSLIDRLIGACEAVNEEIKAVKSGEWYRQMKGEQE